MNEFIPIQEDLEESMESIDEEDETSVRMDGLKGEANKRETSSIRAPSRFEAEEEENDGIVDERSEGDE